MPCWFRIPSGFKDLPRINTALQKIQHTYQQDVHYRSSSSPPSREIHRKTVYYQQKETLDNLREFSVENPRKICTQKSREIFNTIQPLIDRLSFRASSILRRQSCWHEDLTSSKVDLSHEGFRRRDVGYILRISSFIIDHYCKYPKSTVNNPRSKNIKNQNTDLYPGQPIQCGSMWIRIRNTGFRHYSKL